MMLCDAAFAASPALTSVMPRGAQRGTEVDIVFAGDRLADAQEVLFYAPGITVKTLKAESPKKIIAHLAIASDAALGEHTLRLRTSTGISELRTFWVGTMPVVEEKEPNSDFDKPQKIELNTTVAGVITNEDVDHFVVEAKKGQRLTAEVEGMRLGETMFDPYLAIYSAKHAELASCDDTAIFRQDPIASIVVPEDGKYIIELHEASYGGNEQSHYRLHIGTFPRPTFAFPMGGQAGTDLAVKLMGDVNGAIAATIHLPKDGDDDFEYVPEQNGQSSPSPIRMRVSPFPNVIEKEPNNWVDTATPIEAAGAFACNGILESRGDADFFKFKAKKGQSFDVNVFARRLGSPIDPVVHIFTMKGEAPVGNDDKDGPDSYVRFTAPADGEYCVRVIDQLGNGGADYAYRIEVTPVQPTLAMSIPLVAANSQERQTISVPRGGRMATLIRATRDAFGGPVKITASNLPKGLTCPDVTVAPELDIAPVVFEAAADAPIAGSLCDLLAASTDPNVKVRSEFNQIADLIVYGNQVAYYQAHVNKLAVAVTDEAPFKLKIVEPKVPLVQSGSMQLKVVVERKPDFKGPISLAMLFNPPGVGSGPATIPENANEALIPLNASGDAKIAKWGICVIGSANVNGPLWSSTQLAQLEIAPPIVNGKLEMAATEQGRPAQVLCNLEQKTPFDGAANIQLLGLPANTTTTTKQITAKDDKIIFDVSTNEKSPTGQHKIFCVVTVTKNGEPITQTIAGGGVLRIDKPSAAAPKPVAQAAAPKAGPVSRLEKLRQEQAEKTK
ncbi:MAG TPA: PPC domain-containing protein [Tepidisphaeraceae bacterium]|nr:PPC domain-containing protein [Tepidisphaeraceae bacterium]